jgi:hypothetical protein
MADMQSGIGRFLGVFLLAHGWQSGLIGTVASTGVVITIPAITPHPCDHAASLTLGVARTEVSRWTASVG